MFEILADKLARLVVEYSIKVARGQLVIIEAPVEAEEFVYALSRYILRAGGIPEVRLQFPGQEYLMLTESSRENLCQENPLERWAVEHASALIRVVAESNPFEAAQIDQELVQLRKTGRQGVFLAALKRLQTGSFSICSVPWPTQGTSLMSKMSRENLAAALEKGCLLDRENPAEAWTAVGKNQQKVIEMLKGIDTLRIVAPGTDLSLRTAGRTWLNCCGKGDLPDGEVFTAPLENSAEGTVAVSFPARHCSGIRLEFRKGKVVQADADSGKEFLLSTLAQSGADRIGEIAIGLNYGLQHHINNILFDEKMGGTVHFALGAAYPASGGTNQSAVHWDLLVDLRQEGRLEADGTIILENGKLQIT